jgi:hypothetical protein
MATKALQLTPWVMVGDAKTSLLRLPGNPARFLHYLVHRIALIPGLELARKCLCRTGTLLIKHVNVRAKVEWKRWRSSEKRQR